MKHQLTEAQRAHVLDVADAIEAGGDAAFDQDYFAPNETDCGTGGCCVAGWSGDVDGDEYPGVNRLEIPWLKRRAEALGIGPWSPGDPFSLVSNATLPPLFRAEWPAHWLPAGADPDNPTAAEAADVLRRYVAGTLDVCEEVGQ